MNNNNRVWQYHPSSMSATYFVTMYLIRGAYVFHIVHWYILLHPYSHCLLRTLKSKDVKKISIQDANCDMKYTYFDMFWDFMAKLMC